MYELYPKEEDFKHQAIENLKSWKATLRLAKQHGPPIWRAVSLEIYCLSKARILSR